MLAGTRTWLRQTVTHYPYVAHVDGVPTYGTGTARNCRLERKRQNIILDEGSEVVSTYQLYLDGSVTVDAKDKFVLSDSTLPPTLSVDDSPGPDGSIWLRIVYA